LILTRKDAPSGSCERVYDVFDEVVIQLRDVSSRRWAPWRQS
jgi:hypothetical protein